MIAGTLEIQMSANLARLAADMQNAKSLVGNTMGNIERLVGGAKAALGALGIGVGVGYFAHLIKGAIDAADNIRDMSKSTGLAVETLAGLGVAAKQSGGDLSSIAQSINKLSVNMGKDAEKFRALGISAKDPMEAFKQLADVFNALQDPQQRAAVAAAALGKSWAGAAPLLAEGGAKIQEMVERGARLSGMTKQMADEADALNDKWVELTGTGGFLNSMVAPLLPLLNALADDMIKVREQSKGATTDFSPMAETFRTIVIVSGNVGFVLRAMGVEIGGLAAQLTAYYSAILNLATYDFKGAASDVRQFAAIRTEMAKDAEESAAKFAKWEKSILAVGTAATRTASALDAHDQVSRRATSEARASAAELAASAKKKGDAFLNAQTVAKASDSAYQSLMRSISEKTALLEAESGGQEKLTDMQKLALKVMVDLRDGSLKLTDAQKIELAGAMEIALAIDKTNQARLAEIKLIVEAERLKNEEFAKSEANQLALIALGEDVSKGLKQYAADLEFETGIMGLSNAEREVAIALRKLESAGINTNTADVKKYTDSIRKSIVSQDVKSGALSAADAWRKAGNDIANSLSKSFGEVGATMGNVFAIYTDGIARQMEMDKKFNEARAAGVDDIAKIEEKYQDDKAKNALGTYGDMAGAAAGFFEKNSKGYNALMMVSKVFHAAELAMTLAELVPKAIGAVLNQGNGDPYTAFPRMAAMAAIVAGLGVAVGGGGGGGVGSNVARERQARIGTGSVLGDADAKSESIRNALEMLDRSSLIGNQHTADMRRSLMSIDASIGGLASLVVRSAGLTGASTEGLNLGTKPNLPAWAGWLTGSAGGGLGSILSGGLTNVMGSIFGAIFGRSTRSLTDSGIQFNQQTAGQARQGVSASGYADVTTNTRSLFGLIRNSSTSRESSTLSPEIRAQFTAVVGNIFDTILGAARIFGSDTNYITQVLEAFQIDFSSISLKDLKGAEIEEALRAYFGKLGDDMAGAAFVGLDKFQKVGEGLLETLVRLSQEFAVTNEVAKILGKDVATAFGAVGFASMGARTHLVQLFGGIDKLSESVKTYYELFFTEEERLARTTSDLAAEFARLNAAVPANNAAFRALVESQDLSTVAGRTMFTALMTIAPAFNSVGAAALQTARAAQEAAAGFRASLSSIFGAGYTRQQQTTQIIALITQLSALSPVIAGLGSPTSILAGLGNLTAAQWQSFRDQNAGNSAILTLIDQIAALYAALQSTNGDLNPIVTTIGDLGGAAADLAARLAQAKDALRAYMNSLLLNEQLSPLTPMQRLGEARSQYETMLALARTGDVNAIQGLSGSSEAYLRIAREIFASSSAYNAIFRQVFGELGSVVGAGAPNFETALVAALPVNSTIASSADVGVLTQAVYSLTMLIADGVTVNDPQIAEQTNAITSAVKRVGGTGALA